MAGVHPHPAGLDLARQCAVGAEQQLLARLAADIERPLDEHAAERPGRQQPAVLAVERHALRDGLVDDLRRQLGEPPHVRLARAEVAALDRVGEQPVDRVAVVRVVLGRVDPALGGDRVRAAGRVLEAESLDRVAHPGQRGGGARARQPGPDDRDHVVGPPPRPDQLVVVLPDPPLLFERAFGDAGVEVHGRRVDSVVRERDALTGGRLRHRAGAEYDRDQREPDGHEQRHPGREPAPEPVAVRVVNAGRLRAGPQRRG